MTCRSGSSLRHACHTASTGSRSRDLRSWVQQTVSIIFVDPYHILIKKQNMSIGFSNSNFAAFLQCLWIPGEFQVRHAPLGSSWNSVRDLPRWVLFASPSRKNISRLKVKSMWILCGVRKPSFHFRTVSTWKIFMTMPPVMLSHSSQISKFGQTEAICAWERRQVVWGAEGPQIPHTNPHNPCRFPY